MQFKLPHWILIALAVLAAAFAGMAQQPDFASAAGLLNALAALFGGASTMVALHAPSIVHAANVQAVVGYERANPSVARVAAERGFIRLRLLAALSILLSVFVIACAAFRAAAPAVGTLGSCVSQFVADNISLDFEALVISLAIHCGADVADVLEVIIESADPNVAQYKGSAQAAKAQPETMARLRMRALASAHRDAGSTP